MTKYLVERYLPGLDPGTARGGCRECQAHHGDDDAGGDAGAVPALDVHPR